MMLCDPIYNMDFDQRYTSHDRNESARSLVSSVELLNSCTVSIEIFLLFVRFILLVTNSSLSTVAAFFMHSLLSPFE